MPKIAVTRWIPDEAVQVLGEAGEVEISPEDRPLTPEELRKFVAGSAAVVSMLHDRIDGSVADAAGPGLKVVANVAVGYDNVEVSALAERGVVVANTPGVLTDATADLAFGLLLAVSRRLGEGERLLRARQPWSFHLGFLLGSGLQGKTLGIVGLGQIGRAVARRAAAFGMRVVYSGRSAKPDFDGEFVSFDELLRRSDFVSLHCPLTPGTRHLVDADALRAMKPGAYLVNTTRGPVVDESALADALEAGEIAGAALDVFEKEPDVEPRLLERDDVVLTPHLGSATVETRTAMAVLAARNVVSVLAGAKPLTEVGR
ncbi:D-glycerate dehydrogenase [Amycolatopsis rubida]|uniref:D-glycerate dehydrogenase n=1 Tax=Amycolatopsis rubida TaxID=112413 RepID=A0A1I6BKZ2_9PSEU|nr:MULTISPECIES: D-glycerate dehydrogenase [Amycolatopsis]MYW95642.1 D-glycerate dehydrogenase [Amycolatopsis rubida]NEC60631.1 D-glycerate dehydrogenase [Amycolatopsis rubida]OAP22426.1 putative 2-hydroxyacid dehydrogenase [Amycolatopsis sp. M39]SFQ81602.1 Lactate dehydrogenase [Amycolatopsis rubida]